MKLTRALVLGSLLSIAMVNGSAEPKWKHFRGMCDASALEMLDDDLFVAANDEDNILRIYSLSREGMPVATTNFGGFYRLGKPGDEMDLEGAARIDDRIYWITSHGANKNGKPRPSRHRFFATQITSEKGVPQLRPAGQVFTGLVREMQREPDLAFLNLGTASQKAPKEADALNIEGLAPTREGHLLIGFRNPIPGGKAVLVPLLNPKQVTAGERPRFGKHFLLDLNGLGIRAMTPHGEGFLIVAGSFDGEGKSQLYRWDGKSIQPVHLSSNGMPGNPEAIATVGTKDSQRLFVLSDDGTRSINGEDCKDLKDDSVKVFRGYEMPLDF